MRCCRSSASAAEGGGRLEVVPRKPVRGLWPAAAERLRQHCDAVLRLPGESAGADRDVAIARGRGLPVHLGLTEVPGIGAAELTRTAVMGRAGPR